MFRGILISAWVAFFTGAALLLLFPKAAVRGLSPAVLLTCSLALILCSAMYGLVVLYRRVTKSKGSVPVGKS